MVYKIILAKSAKRDFGRIDTKYKSSLAKAIQRISISPKLGKPLSGRFKSLWRLRFSRYRIVYKIIEKEAIVLIVSITHRKEVYN